MHKLKKNMIYPYFKKYFPIIKSLIHKYPDYEYTIVSPKAWTPEKDAGYIVNRETIGINVSNDFYGSLHNSDTLIIPNIENIEFIKADVIDKMEYALSNGHDILCYLILEDNIVERLKLNSEKYNVKFDYIIENTAYNNFNFIEAEIKTPDIPIVFIGELFPDLDSTESAITLHESLELSGYKSISIMSDINTTIISSSYITIPKTFFSNDIIYSDKVFLINGFINNIIERYRPDIIIFQMPEPMFKYNDTFTNGFGIYPYIISQAITPDFLIISAAYELIESKFFTLLSQNFKYRFGCEIDIVIISNIYFDLESSLDIKEMTYNHYNIDQISDNINDFYKDTDIPIISIKDVNKIFDIIFND
jgi:hypothetical protein